VIERDANAMIGKAMISSRVIAAAIGVLLASPLTTTQATTVHREW
jgi:hypothetical protein